MCSFPRARFTFLDELLPLSPKFPKRWFALSADAATLRSDVPPLLDAESAVFLAAKADGSFWFWPIGRKRCQHARPRSAGCLLEVLSKSSHEERPSVPRSGSSSERFCVCRGGGSRRVDLGRLEPGWPRVRQISGLHGALPGSVDIPAFRLKTMSRHRTCLPKLWHHGGEGSASPPNADEEIVAFQIGCDEDSGLGLFPSRASSFGGCGDCRRVLAFVEPVRPFGDIFMLRASPAISVLTSGLLNRGFRVVPITEMMHMKKSKMERKIQW